MIFTIALRQKHAYMSLTYILYTYKCESLILTTDLRFLTLRNDMGFSHRHVHEHVMRFYSKW